METNQINTGEHGFNTDQNKSRTPTIPVVERTEIQILTDSEELTSATGRAMNSTLAVPLDGAARDLGREGLQGRMRAAVGAPARVEVYQGKGESWKALAWVVGHVTVLDREAWRLERCGSKDRRPHAKPA